ncbi:MAG: Phenylalanine-tRNA ligase alpha subunit [Candidatus Woesebacteria bacterium GW2011_GWB1_43_14]|uniref:Phenylalanine--tRNA ligase alpha subunit n=1 Tax=Candidatus Woesebacteria bacterium GW2011_GWB1_43_14 TaxID=1618578 RepID=A0A0G1GDW3_9BACT|nr:MAG: phenylalanyl-tRNA synthetase subunit alpha, phenylalanyl-tRNA synthetase alpha chain [Candidatus Woesebacteria bacterium GW2011_GWC1_42_9]KKS97058.1 MAG: Phenylalanine-tRNA ligase alpha subunit [Candidatus Woesebacteria bacterium GW2011_GWB1_43_14]
MPYLNIQKTLVTLRNEFTAQIVDAKDLPELEELRIAYLGRNGKLTLLIREISNLPPEMKKKLGILINETKSTLNNLIISKKNELKKKGDWFDYSIPGIRAERGHLHLITQAIEEISSIFSQIGFTRVRYPEVEWDWFAFEGLNFGKDHPARDDWETFWLKSPDHPKFGPMLLTPHTSNGQIREMVRTKKPPIRMINIAKCYRRQSDASHTPVFHQFEGLVIDKNISVSNLKGTLDYFVRQYFGSKRVTRLRPHHFPFTEPSFEVDIVCDICMGKGCRLCKDGWLELAGAGMTHPNVLRAGGIDPDKHTAFAFGTGVERVLMMRSGLKIPDLRILYSSNLEYLKQF